VKKGAKVQKKQN